MNNLSKNRCLLLWIIALIAGLLIWGCQRQGPRKTGRRNNPFRVTSDDLLGVKAVGAEEAWVVGSFGNIFHTSDGGLNWQKQNSTGEQQLCEVEFVDSRNGWIVGSNGTIIHTSDGGKTWIRQNSQTERLLLNVDFVDPLQGWVVGEQGTLLRTRDGGTTWEDHSIAYGPVLNGVSFVDNKSGWIVGDYGTILFTSDGGTTWEEQKCRDIVPVIRPDEWEQPLPMLFDVCFIDSNRGWIAGIEGVILITEDGGRYWRKLPTHTSGKVYSIVVSGKMGVAVGGKGTYLYSGDAGLTWTLSVDAVKTRRWLRDVDLFDNKAGWIVGAMGTLIKTVDGGEHWEMVSGRSYELPHK